jgi:hypothetical protein
MKVPLQGHRPHCQPGALAARVAVAGRVQQSIRMIQQSIHSVRRAGCRRTIICYGKILPTPAQLQHHLRRRSAHVLGCPLSQPPQALRKRLLRLSVIVIPYARQHLPAQIACASGGDLQHRMRVAQHKPDVLLGDATFGGGLFPQAYKESGGWVLAPAHLPLKEQRDDVICVR